MKTERIVRIAAGFFILLALSLGVEGSPLFHSRNWLWFTVFVMVITMFGDERHVLACIEAGATGYILKGAPTLDIVEQIRALCAGGSPISPIIARRLLSRFREADIRYKPATTVTGRLSEKEHTVLEMKAKGYTYEEIAGLLGLSRHTVETYVKRIYRKLQVHSKSEAIYEARQLGVIG